MSLIAALNEQATLKINIFQNLAPIEETIRNHLKNRDWNDPVTIQLQQILLEIEKKKFEEAKRAEDRFSWYHDILNKATKIQDSSVAVSVVNTIVHPKT